jgi:hypothetical protein
VNLINNIGLLFSDPRGEKMEFDYDDEYQDWLYEEYFDNE